MFHIKTSCLYRPLKKNNKICAVAPLIGQNRSCCHEGSWDGPPHTHCTDSVGVSVVTEDSGDLYATSVSH